MSSEEAPGVRVILALRNGLQQIVDELNAILDELAPPELAEGPVSVTGIPKIDIDDLNVAPWTSYKTKKEAEPGESAWIKNPGHFTDFEAPQVIFELVKALTKAKGERLQLGDMEYFFSGEKKFVARRPAKKERAR